MFNSVFTKTIWEHRKAISFWSLGIFLYALMIGLLYPSMEGVEGLAALSEDMPDAFKALVGEIHDITTPTGFLGAEFYNMTLPLLLSILAIGFGASTISKEEESGTIELLLASPLNRTTILIQKYLALVFNLFIVGFFAWIAIYITTLVVDFDVNLVNVAQATLAAILLALCFGSLALSVTALGGKRGLSIGITTVIFVVSYFLNTLVVLVTEIEPLQKWSLMYYYEGQNVLNRGFELSNVAILLSVIIVVYVIGSIRFKYRDIGS